MRSAKKLNYNMKIQRKSDRLFSNKKIITAVLLLIFIGLIVFVGVKTHESPIKRKLTGTWNVEFENSEIVRYGFYEFSWMPLNINDEGTISLPSMHIPLDMDLQGRTLLDYFTEEEMEKFAQNFERRQQVRTGTWQIISTNPDSVLFNAPEHPLHGRYAVRFFIDERGWVLKNMRNNIFKMELTNDSTILILNKAGIMLERSLRNWEGRN